MVKVIAVFGLSGVGKSWLISRFASANPVAHVQASQLLREAKAAISGSVATSEELRIGASVRFWITKRYWSGQSQQKRQMRCSQ
jgi:adenylate kinase family enzyme